MSDIPANERYPDNAFGGNFTLRADGKLYPVAPKGCYLDDAGNIFDPVPRCDALVSLIEGLGNEQVSGTAPIVIRKSTLAASEG